MGSKPTKKREFEGEHTGPYWALDADSLSEADERGHLEEVRQIMEAHGFPMPDWKPKLP